MRDELFQDASDAVGSRSARAAAPRACFFVRLLSVSKSLLAIARVCVLAYTLRAQRRAACRLAEIESCQGGRVKSPWPSLANATLYRNSYFPTKLASESRNW